MIAIKRAYDPPSRGDGRRILVDRLWPRGVSRGAARIDEWAKELAPSDALRRWFGKDPAKWPEFRRRYRRELATHAERLAELAREAARARVTFVYGKRDTVRNNAAVLKAVLDAWRRRGGRPGVRRRAPANRPVRRRA